jgi:hypothetical protein
MVDAATMLMEGTVDAAMMLINVMVAMMFIDVRWTRPWC